MKKRSRLATMSLEGLIGLFGQQKNEYDALMYIVSTGRRRKSIKEPKVGFNHLAQAAKVRTAMVHTAHAIEEKKGVVPAEIPEKPHCAACVAA